MLNAVNRICHMILKIGLVDSQIVGLSAFSYNTTSGKVLHSRARRIYSFLVSILFTAAIPSFLLKLTDEEWTYFQLPAFMLVTNLSLAILLAWAASALCWSVIIQSRIIDLVNRGLSIKKKLCLRMGDNIFDTNFLIYLSIKAFIDLLKRIHQLFRLFRTIPNTTSWELISWVYSSYTINLGEAMVNFIIGFMMSVGQSFDLCAREVQTIIVKLDGRPGGARKKAMDVELSCKVSDEVDEIMSLWKLTYDIWMEGQAKFHYHNLALVSGCYWNTVLQLYHGFVAHTTDASNEDHTSFDEIFSAVAVFCELALFVIVTSSTGESMQKVRYQLERILDLPDVDDRLVRNVECHILASLLNEKRLTIYHLFKLDRTALLQLFSATILYLTIVIQFHKNFL